MLKSLPEYHHNWRNHKLNRDNPFETPLSCGVTNKMLAILFYVARFEVKLLTVELERGVFSAEDHGYLLSGHEHEAVIVDGAWKLFFYRFRRYEHIDTPQCSFRWEPF
jgi:hypothetical protein